MSKVDKRKKEFVETLNVTTIYNDVNLKNKKIVEKGFSLSEGISILLRTEEGKELLSKRSQGKIDAREFRKGILILAKKHRHLLVYYVYEE